MSVSSISSLNPATYQSTTPSVTSSTSASASSPVVPSNDPGLAQQVSALSTTAGVVATLGSSNSSSDALTYDAAGLYNSIAQAGQSATTTPAATTPAASTAATGTTTPATTSTTSSTASTGTGSGYYNGSGVLQTDPASGSNLTANWASALQENPTLSNTVAADSFAQGIIGTLSVTA